MSDVLAAWRNLAKDTLNLYVRAMSLAIAAALFVFGWDLVMNPIADGFRTGIFDVVIRMAPLTTWGLAFWLLSSVFIVAAMSGRFVIYVLALIFAVTLQGGWFAGIVYARFVEGAPITTAHIGLWMLAFSLTIGTAFVPNPLHHESSAICVVDENDNTVVELHRAG